VGSKEELRRWHSNDWVNCPAWFCICTVKKKDTALLPPGGYPIAVTKYITYQIKYIRAPPILSLGTKLLQALAALPPKTEAPVRFGYKAVWTFRKFVTPADTRTPDLPDRIISAREITPSRLSSTLSSGVIVPCILSISIRWI
jgi:hypothetical protein